MDGEKQKAQAFIMRLLGNPALHTYSVLQKEEQILQFLKENARQLYPTLSSPAFFPGKDWNTIYGILRKALFGVIDTVLYKDLNRILSERIRFAFFTFIDNRDVREQTIKEQLLAFLSVLLNRPDARRDFTGPFTALQNRFAEKYLNEVFTRKSYVHFELTKVQRLRMGREEIRNFVEVTLLLKPALHLLGPDAWQSRQDPSAGMVQHQFADKVLAVLNQKLNLFPEAVLRSGVDASVSFIDNRFIEATSRIGAVLGSRCRSFRPDIKVDRGADTPDKSWFSIARLNYKYYGFDIKLLDEFYQIAAEKGW
ncbi:MAG: hypothetical protein ACLFST_01725 [Spirochaetia bacterium]